MANYRAIASGNWSNGATWAGGSVPPNGEGHNIYSNNLTVTIDTNVDVALITNAAITASFVGGGTSASHGGVFNISSATPTTLVANITGGANIAAGASVLNYSASAPATLAVTGNLTGASNTNGAFGCNAINLSGSGTLNFNGNLTAGGTGGGAANAIQVSGTGSLVVQSANIITQGSFATIASSSAIHMSGAGSVTLNNSSLTASNSYPAVNTTAGTVTAINCVFTASTAGAAFSSTVGGNRLSGSFIAASNGMQPINAARWFLNTEPSNAYIQHALDGLNANSFRRYYTADNGLGQASPTDVRSGVSYASGNLTGRLTVPARGSVALSVNYGPSMPFTATRSGTTATATLAYGYPLVVGDQITVTGASNSEWNSTYTIASVVSGTSVTFVVPATHIATAGAGALMQTTGTAVLDPAAVASAVWGAASRTITGGLVDTATTLTNSPDVPTESEIAAAVRTELDSSSTKLANLDASISSRLAGSAYTPPANSDISAIKSKTDNIPASPAAVSDIPTAAQISAAVEGSLLNEADGQAVLNAIVTAIGNTNLSEVSLVAAVRADLERTGGKMDSIPTTAAPTAAQNATAVWGAATKEITGGTVTNLTNAPASVTPTDIWSYNARTLTSASGPTAVQIRQEMDSNSTQLSAIKAKTDNLPADPADQSLLEAAIAGVTAPTAGQVASQVRTELSSELAKVAALNTERLANVATTAIVGNLIAQANS